MAASLASVIRAGLARLAYLGVCGASAPQAASQCADIVRRASASPRQSWQRFCESVVVGRASWLQATMEPCISEIMVLEGSAKADSCSHRRFGTWAVAAMKQSCAKPFHVDCTGLAPDGTTIEVLWKCWRHGDESGNSCWWDLVKVSGTLALLHDREDTRLCAWLKANRDK